MSNIIEEFHEIIGEQLEQLAFIKLVISNKRSKSEELKSVNIKPIQIKKGLMLSFVYRYPTKDITKNFSFNEGKTIVIELLENTFRQAELVAKKGSWHLNISKKGKAKISKGSANKIAASELQHDKQKQRLITPENNIYLKELGVTDVDERVKPSMQDKFKQINKYIEIIEGILKSTKIESPFYVADMGAGKGYLTFALYDYLINSLNLKPNICGVEFRKDLVDKCNSIAQKSGFKNLSFVEGTIKDSVLTKVDLLIALHACDTATDDAIFRGIKSGAKIIVCAPCCHKQIRKQINPADELNLITQYGILKERQAEILTDTIRSQILEAYGYKTKVFEFISTEHTPKNVMIVGVKSGDIEIPNKSILQGIAKLKEIHGVEYHYLERLLEIC